MGRVRLIWTSSRLTSRDGRLRVFWWGPERLDVTRHVLPLSIYRTPGLSTAFADRLPGVFCLWAGRVYTVGVNREKFLSSLAILAVVGITVGYFAMQTPEEIRVVSLDGVVTVTGLARQTQPFQIEAGRTVMAPLLGESYVLKPDLIVLDEPAVLAFALDETVSANSDSLELFRFHPSLKMWELMSSVIARTDELLAVETTQLGEFAIGVTPEFVAPIFSNVYSELLVLAPVETVGYEISVGYARLDQETVRLAEVGEIGGCDGMIGVGDGESLSRLERQVQVEINNQPELVTMVFMAEWFTSSAGGCERGVELKPNVSPSL